MIEALIGQALPYLIAIITAAGAILGGFLFGRRKGKAAERLRNQLQAYEASAKARERVREVDQKHHSMATDDRRERVRERLRARDKAKG